MLPKLARIAAKYPILKETRGRGLLIGLEFINCETGARVAKELFGNGILIADSLNNSTTIRIEPTLTIGIDQLDRVVEIIEKVVNPSLET